MYPPTASVQFSQIRRGRMMLLLTLGLFFVSDVGCNTATIEEAAHGFVETQFTDKDGSNYTYLTFVPYDYEPGQKRPLLLFLNGRGENGVDGYWTIHNNFGIELWEMKRHFPFICAIPQCPDDKGWSGQNLQRAFDFADEVAKTYGTDEDRVYITGVSQGGQGVWNAISQSPERFAAAVPLCGSPSIDIEAVAKSGIPIWNQYNEQDAPTLVESNRQVRLKLMEAGASPIYTEYQASGHNCWDRAYRSAPVYQWMLEQQRGNDRESGAAFELFSAEDIVANWVSPKGSSWRVAENRVVPPDDDSNKLEMLVSDNGYRHFELHLDAYLGAESKGCRIGITNEAPESNSTPTLEIVIPFTEQGVGGIRTSDGRWIASLDPLAQRQLLSEYGNDLRMHWRDEHIKLCINGCTAFNVPIPAELLKGESEIRPILLADHDVSWQHIRLKILD